jgi:hydroxymethylpyrimidine pyrophosphatase-like HAD family hydrolase
MYEQNFRVFFANIAFVDDLEKVVADATKFTVYFPNKNSMDHYEKLFKPTYGAEFSVTIGDTIFIDVMNYGINKGKAMRLLGERLGVTADQMMAFGDTYNDIEMLQAVKHSYIVKNARADMKQYANYIADTNDNFGVIKVIDEVIRNTRKA